MAFLKRFNLLIYMLAGLSIAAFTFAEDNAPFLVFGVGMLALSYWVVERPGSRPIPRWVINAGVLIATLYLFWELVLSDHRDNLILPLGHLMIGLLVCKMFETKTNRDFGTILVLSLLIIVSATILGTSVLFGVILVAYLFLGLYTSLVFHLRYETDRAALRHAAFDVAASRPGGGTTIGRDLRRMTVLSACVLLIISVVAFLTIPRSRAGMLGNWRNSMRTNSQSGFSDHVGFSDISRLQLSDALAMDVKLERDGQPYGSASLQPYFRGMGLDYYDSNDHLWVHTQQYPEHPFLLDEYHTVALIAMGSGTGQPAKYTPQSIITQHYTLHYAGNNTLFAMSPPVGIRSTQIRGGAFAPQDFTISFQNATVPFEYEVDSPQQYKNSVFEDPADVVPLPRVMGDFWNMLAPAPYAMSPVPAGIAKMAKSREVLGGLAKLLATSRESVDFQMQCCYAIEGYLRSHYPYSLEHKIVDPKLDPTEDFLVNCHKTGGHCEYFASAMVMMVRSLGIPARMEIGYHGGDFNSLGSYYVVRQRYAHAWVEAYFPGHGWVTFDPSPPSGLTGTDSSNALMKWIRDAIDTFQKNWLNGIINFDNRSRRWVLGGVGNLFSSMRTALHHWKEVLVEALTVEISRPARVVVVVLVATLLGVFGFSLKRWWDLRHSIIAGLMRNLDRRSKAKLRHDLAFFDQLVRLLKRTGAKRDVAQTPREFVAAALEQAPAALGPALWLTSTFYDIRYGTETFSARLEAKIQEALAQVRQNLPE